MTKKIIFPPSLKPGDTIRIIAPASSPKNWKKLQSCIDSFKQLGFKITLGKNLRAQKGYLAGSDKQRLDDLHDAFKDKSVKGIICLRGGYGTPRLLNKINYSLIRNNPKILCGFSDITALHLSILTKSRVGTFLGPNLFSFFVENKFSDLSLRSFMSSVMSDSKKSVNPFEPLDIVAKKKIKIINAGKIKGWAVGGNLSLITFLIGTEYLPSLNGGVLFLEEVNEPAYRIDRMLTQLILSGALKGIKGFVIGQCIGCQDYEQVFIERLKPLGKPIMIGAPFGHIDHMITISLGKQLKL